MAESWKARTLRILGLTKTPISCRKVGLITASERVIDMKWVAVRKEMFRVQYNELVLWVDKAWNRELLAQEFSIMLDTN
jgi:hypothetical protein